MHNTQITEKELKQFKDLLNASTRVQNRGTNGRNIKHVFPTKD